MVPPTPSMSQCCEPRQIGQAALVAASETMERTTEPPWDCERRGERRLSHLPHLPRLPSHMAGSSHMQTYISMWEKTGRQMEKCEASVASGAEQVGPVGQVWQVGQAGQLGQLGQVRPGGQGAEIGDRLPVTPQAQGGTSQKSVCSARMHTPAIVEHRSLKEGRSAVHELQSHFWQTSPRNATIGEAHPSVAHGKGSALCPRVGDHRVLWLQRCRQPPPEIQSQVTKGPSSGPRKAIGLSARSVCVFFLLWLARSAARKPSPIHEIKQERSNYGVACPQAWTTKLKRRIKVLIYVFAVVFRLS